MEKLTFKSFIAVFLCIGLIWSRSIFEKISSGNFADNLGKILTKTTQNNPYLFYKNFLQDFAIPNSYLFGNLVMWGEFLVAISITSSVIYILLKSPKENLAFLTLTGGLLGGIFLNINFWFAFSVGNPGTDSLNLLMILIQIIGVWYLIKLLRSKIRV